jgi:hypothetical protein
MFRFAFFVAILVGSTVAFAQAEKPATASITGRIIANEQPLSGVTVMIYPADPIQYNQQGPQRRSTKTDSSGRYRFVGLSPGRFTVSPRALAYVVPMDTAPGMPVMPGKIVQVSEGEQVENLDFTLLKGGVITGTITDELDRPIIAQRVQLRRFTTTTQTVPVTGPGNFNMFETDDYGRYRLYGLQAGRYLLSAGEVGDTGIIGQAGRVRRQTYYPGVREQKDAKVLELSEGGEVTDIDIKLPKAEKLYEVRGRVIDASTNKPVIGMSLVHGYLNKAQTQITGAGGAGARGLTTNELGEFSIQGVGAGKYAVMLYNPNSEYYGDPLVFEVTDHNVEGLELKALRGSSISGVIVMEGTNDPALLKSVSVSAIALSPPGSLQAPTFGVGRSTSNPDGTFQVSGLRPGKNTVRAGTLGEMLLVLARIERDGVEIREFEIAAGEHLTGFKIVMAYGAGVIRGQVNIVEGTLPSGLLFTAALVRPGGTEPLRGPATTVDVRGKFVLKGILPGEYEVELRPLIQPGGQPTVQMAPLKQRVTVGTGETDVTFTVDLGAKKEGQQ